MTRSRTDLRRIALLIAGWIFVVLGIAGLFLPILQGILFLLVGLTLLSLGSPRIRLLRIRLGRRYPALRVGEEKARAWLRRQRGRFFPGRDRGSG